MNIEKKRAREQNEEQKEV